VNNHNLVRGFLNSVSVPNFKTGWGSFHFRMHGRKLGLFCTIRNYDSPLYLYDCLVRHWSYISKIYAYEIFPFTIDFEFT
jgi:hypothetical protein